MVRWLALAIVVSAGLPAAPAAAQTYTFKTIDYSKKDATILWDINASSAIVGDYTDKHGTSHCFLLTGSTKTPVSDPSGPSTQCYGINAAGAIVGAYPLPVAFSNGFLYAGGVFSDVVPPNAVGTTAYGISDTGVVIGTYIDNTSQHGFLFDTAASSYTSFDIPGAAATLGIAINSHGQYVVLASDGGGSSHSYLNTATSSQELIYPGATTTLAHHLNNKGQVSLAWIDAGGVSHGGVFDSARSVYYPIDDPGQATTSIRSINDRQTLVGSFLAPADTRVQGFKATGHLRR